MTFLELPFVAPFSSKKTVAVEPQHVFLGYETKKEKQKKKKLEELQSSIHDESHVLKDCPLKLLKPVILHRTLNNGQVMNIDNSSEIEKDFSYLYSTRGAEVKSDRTNFFENKLKEMLAGEDYSGSVQVVIFTRTSELEAYVYPDGTICISQALINLLETVDEVLAVLAHELGHLIYKTVETAYTEQKVSRGIDWLHEFLATDLQTTRLLEKVGVNSQALADVFLKFEKQMGNTRGVAHQSHSLRSFNIKLLQRFIPSTTSAKEKQSLPDTYIFPEKKTNLELSDEVIKSKSSEVVLRYLECLHPEDRYTWISRVISGGRSHSQTFINDAFIDFITNQFKTIDSKKLRQFFFIALDARQLLDKQIVTVQDATDLIKNINSLFKNDQATTIWSELFIAPLGSTKSNFFHSCEFNLLSAVHRRLLTQESFKEFNCSDEQLIQVIQEIYSFYDVMDKFRTTNSYHSSLIQDSNDIVFHYIDQKYLSQADWNEDDLRNLLLRLMESNFDFSEDWNFFAQLKNKNKLPDFINIYAEVSNVEIEIHEVKHEEEYTNVDQFFVEMEGILQNVAHPNDFIKSFRNVLFGFLQPEKYSEDRLSQELQLWKAEQGKVIAEWIKKVDLVKFFRSDFERSIFRMQLFHEIIERCLYNEIPEDEYILIINEMMDASDANLNNLQFFEIYRLITTLDVVHKMHYGGKIQIIDTDKLYSTKFYKLLYEKRPQMVAANLQSLFREVSQRREMLGNGARPFTNDILSCWLFGDIASELLRLLPTAEIEDIPQILNIFELLSYEHKVKDLKRKLILKYLESESKASLRDKADILVLYHSEVGYDGLVTLCKQIHTYDEFVLLSADLEKLMSEYLSGKKDASKAAIIDFAVSIIGKGFEVIKTIDSQSDHSATNSAQMWLNVLNHSGYEFIPPATIMIEQFGSMRLSLHEIFVVLKDLDPMTKVAIAVRVLGDIDSPISGDKKTQKEFLDFIFKMFEVNNPFIRLGLEGAMKNGRRDVVIMLLAQLLGPVLFRNLSMSKVNYSQIHKQIKKTAKKDKTNIPNYLPYIEKILNLESSELFKISFEESPEDLKPYLKSSTLAQKSIAKQAGDYMAVQEAIRNRFDLNSITKQSGNTENTQLDFNGNEAIISGLERGGALFVRCLQIASQLFSFDPETTKRLANTLDQAEKMDEFRFWTALKTYADKFPHFGEWLKNNFVRLENVIGGGSLYTTYAVVVRRNGQEVPAVLKLLKPNSEAELKDSRSISLAAIHNIISAGSQKEKERAKLAKRIVEMAYEWCSDDINDTNYLEDDEDFSRTIQNFNSQNPTVKIEQSQTFFADTFATCESRYQGRTLNSMLQDQKISEEQKRKLFEAYMRFYQYQSVNDEIGSLSHSDPHVGNYQVINTGNATEPIVLGMMDRRLYLHDSYQDKSVLQAIRDNNQMLFLTSFIELMCDINHKKSQKDWISKRVKSQLLFRKVRTLFDKKESFIGDFNIISAELEKVGVHIPYQWQLRIRNEFMVKKTWNRLQ